MVRYKPGYKKVQIVVNEELWEEFRTAIKPLKLSKGIEAYIRLVVNSKKKPLQEVIDTTLEEIMKN